MSLFIIVIGLIIAAVILYFTWRNLNESDNKVNGSNIVNGSNESSNGNGSNIVNGSNESSNGSTGSTIPIDNNIEDTKSVTESVTESTELVNQEDDALSENSCMYDHSNPDYKPPEQEEQNEPINQLIQYEEPPDDPLESVNPITPSDNQPSVTPSDNPYMYDHSEPEQEE